MASACSSCNSVNLIIEDHGGQTHKVCTDCGEVVDSVTSFEQDIDYWNNVTLCNASGSLQGSNFGKCRNIAKSNPNAAPRMLIPWLKYVREICNIMKLTTEMQRGVTDLFTQAFNHPSFRYKQRVMKQGLCGAVLFIICRQHDWPVILSDISTVVQSPKKAIYAMIQMMMRELNVKTIPVMDIEDIVMSVLKKYGFQDDMFIDKAIKLVSLAKDAWITCGRSQDAVIVAAAFLVWKSSEGKGKGNKLPVFYRRFKVSQVPVQTTKRVKEIQDVLNQLVGKLPWLNKSAGKVTPEMATQHLDDILRYKRILLSRVEGPKEEDDEGVDDDAKMGETNHERNEDTRSNSSCLPSSQALLPPSYYKKRKAETCGTGMEPPSKMTTLESSWETEMLNLGEELTDKDIPESEMHLYLRSAEEVAQLETLQREFVIGE